MSRVHRGIPERTDARPPNPLIEIPSRINVRRMHIRRCDVEKYGPTKGCPGCQKVTRELCIHASWLHISMGAVNAWGDSWCKIPSGRTGSSEQMTRHEEHSQNTWKNAMKEIIRSQDIVATHMNRVIALSRIIIIIVMQWCGLMPCPPKLCLPQVQWFLCFILTLCGLAFCGFLRCSFVETS